MWTLAAAVVLLSAWSLGLALVELAERWAKVSARRDRLERHALGILLGLAAMIELEVGLTVALGPLSSAFVRVMCALCFAVGVPFLRASLRPGDLPPPPQSMTLAHRIGLLAVGLFAAFAAFYAASMPMHLFDSMFHFAYKGKLIAHEGFSTPSWLVDPLYIPGKTGVGRVITHPNYPPGVGALHALVAQVGNRFDEDATRALMAVFALAPAALLWSVLRRRSRGAAIFGSLGWIALPLLYYSRLPAHLYDYEFDEQTFLPSLFGFGSRHASGELSAGAFFLQRIEAFWISVSGLFTRDGLLPDGWTMDGAADLPLAAFVAAAFVQLMRFVPGQDRGANRSDVVLGGLGLGAVLLTKNEGIALLAVVVASVGLGVLLTSQRRMPHTVSRMRGLAALAIAALIGLLLAAPWLAIRGQIPSIDEDYPRALKIVFGLEEPAAVRPHYSNQPNDIGQALDRVPTVFGGYLLVFTHVLRWNMTWWLFVAGLIAVAWRTRLRLFRHPAMSYAAAVVIAALGYAVTLLLTPWSLPLLFGTTIPGRLMLHVAPLAIVAGVAFAFSRPQDTQAVESGPDPTVDSTQPRAD